ncbi:MAG: ABC transporter permease [Micromonosporaceae bacterium]|nr:ABC transporter permease [Micromonosporaceae bacterium]
MSTLSSSINRSSPINRLALRRVWWLSRTEFTLFWRNKTAVVTALVLPAAMVVFYARIDASATGGISVNAYILTGAVALMLLFVVYYNLVTAYVARREELVLKRLRTGEARDGEILAAGALPAAVVALAQTAVAVGIGAVLLDLPVPVNVVVLLVGLLGGIVVFALLAAASTAFTKTVEFAQISTLPVLMICVVGSGALVPLSVLPDAAAAVLRFVPLAPVVDLLRLGWVGGPDGAGFLEAFGRAGEPVAILVGWIVVGWLALRRWFRWEPRRS